MKKSPKNKRDQKDTNSNKDSDKELKELKEKTISKNSINKNTIKENSKENKDLISVYSNIGYIQVNKNDFKDNAYTGNTENTGNNTNNPDTTNTNNSLLKFEKKNKSLEGRIQKTSLTEKIKINVKTLHGNRAVYNFDVNIHSKLNTLIHRLLEEEDKLSVDLRWSKDFQYRLISTNGLIKELNPSKSFYEEELKNNETIILASPYKLYFSEVMKHKGIYVSIFIP